MISNTAVHELANHNVVEGQEIYINASAICKATNKRWNDYSRLETTKVQLTNISKETGIAKSKLVLITQGGNPSAQGTWIHPMLVPKLTEWCASQPSNQKEKRIQKEIALYTPGAKREVTCPAGKIDVLSSLEIIEVKTVGSWIYGVGQLTIYGYYYPELTKRLHLFGEISEKLSNLIEEHCSKLNIKVTYEV